MKISIVKLIHFQKQSLVNCTWGEWKHGDCSVTCNGEGLRTNHRIKIEEELFGGIPCNGSATMTELCNNGECPGIHSLRNVDQKVITFLD